MSRLKKTVERLARRRFYQDWIAGCFDTKSKDFRETIFAQYEKEYLSEARVLIERKG